MKRSMLAMAALTAFAGVASAQSSVTVFGIVDLSLRNVKNGSAGDLNTMASGGSATNRLGFRGVEDLGGGLKANFWLESEVAPDTGAAGSTVGTNAGVFWARRATVGLSGNFGEFRMGRDYTPNFNSWNSVEVFGYVGVATPANIRGTFYGNSIVNTAVRNSNTVSYFLPTMGGLYGQAQIGLDEKAANQNKSSAFRLGYAAGPVNVGGSWQRVNRVLTMVDNITTWNFVGSYNAGVAIFGAGYEKSDYSTRNQKLATFNVQVPFGASTFKAQYTKGTGNGNLPGVVAGSAADLSKQYDASMIGLGYVYSFSKRTSLYANYGRVNNDGSSTNGAVYTAGGGGPAGIGRGQTSTGYEFGIRHDF